MQQVKLSALHLKNGRHFQNLTTSGMSERVQGNYGPVIFCATNPQFALCLSCSVLGAGCHWPAHQSHNRKAQNRRVHHTDSEAPEAQGKAAQAEMVFDEGKGLSTEKQQYDPTSIINEVRGHVDAWLR